MNDRSKFIEGKYFVYIKERKKHIKRNRDNTGNINKTTDNKNSFVHAKLSQAIISNGFIDFCTAIKNNVSVLPKEIRESQRLR